MDTGVSWLINSAYHINPILLMVRAICGAFGLAVGLTAIRSMMVLNKAGKPSNLYNLGLLIIGSLFFTLQATLEMWSKTVFGLYDGPDFNYMYKPVSSDDYKNAIHVFVYYIYLMGVVINIRGLYLCINGPKYNKEGWFLKALALFFLAGCCANFYLFVDMVSETVSANKVGTEYFKFNWS